MARTIAIGRRILKERIRKYGFAFRRKEVLIGSFLHKLRRSFLSDV